MQNPIFCLICGSDKFQKLPTYSAHLSSYLIKCSKCGLIQWEHLPDEKKVGNMYDTEYFDTGDWCWYGEPYTKVWKERKEEFEVRVLKILKRLKLRGNTLDIGCAGGACLLALKEAGYSAWGLEPNEEIAQWGRTNLGVRIEIGTLKQTKFSPGFFDIVYCGDLIEHLRSPLAFLSEVKKLMKQDGILVIEMPFEANRLSFRAGVMLNKLRRRKVLSLSRPYHLYFYTPKTIKELLSLAGFSIKLFKTWKEKVAPVPLLVCLLDRLGAAVFKLHDRGLIIATLGVYSRSCACG